MPASTSFYASKGCSSFRQGPFSSGNAPRSGARGRLALSVWTSTGVYNSAVGKALIRFVDEDTASRFCASRNVPAKEELGRLAVAAGFSAVDVRVARMNVHLPRLDRFTLDHLAGTPVAAAIAALDPDSRKNIGASVMHELQRFNDGDGITYPEEIHVVTARIESDLRPLERRKHVPYIEIRPFRSHPSLRMRLWRRATAQQSPGSYPSKPVKIVIPLGPGNSLEIAMRLVAEKLTSALGQPFVIEAQPGAAGQIGTERVARSPADGYTLLSANDGIITMLPNLQKHVPFDRSATSRRSSR